jgi:hypothetical protein
VHLRVEKACLVHVCEPHSGEHALVHGSVDARNREIRERPLYTVDGSLWVPRNGSFELVWIPPVTRRVFDRTSRRFYWINHAKPWCEAQASDVGEDDGEDGERTVEDVENKDNEHSGDEDSQNSEGDVEEYLGDEEGDNSGDKEDDNSGDEGEDAEPDTGSSSDDATGCICGTYQGPIGLVLAESVHVVTVEA